MRVVARAQLVAFLSGRLPESADRFYSFLGFRPDVPADRQLVLDVLGEIGCVEREYEAIAAQRLVELDHEALVAWSMPIRRDSGDAGRDLGLAVGELPFDARVVKIDASDRVVFGFRMVGQPVFEFAALR